MYIKEGFFKDVVVNIVVIECSVIYLWRGDYFRIKLFLCKNDMLRLYILNFSFFFGKKKIKVGLEKKIFFIIFSNFYIFFCM